MNAIGTKLLPNSMNDLVSGGLAVLNALDRGMKDIAGITLAEYSVLDLILTNNRGDPLCMSELAETLACQKSNMTQLIDRMQKRKLVRRKPHLYNQRMLMVYVQSAGVEAHTIVVNKWEALMDLAKLTASRYGHEVEVV